MDETSERARRRRRRALPRVSWRRENTMKLNDDDRKLKSEME
jgi:hypothetical protein